MSTSTSDTASLAKTPMSAASEPLRALLVALAERYVDDPRRPCCDDDTVLQDWLDAMPAETVAVAFPLGVNLPAAAGPRRVVLIPGQPVPAGVVDVGDDTCWANPYRIGEEVTVSTDHHDCAQITMTPAMAVACYADDIDIRVKPYPDDHPDDAAITRRWISDLAGLRGHDLGCVCPREQPCHADVLLERANCAA